MAAFLVYILKWALTLTLLYSLYGLLLRKETFHSFNRVVLLGILCLSFMIPLFPLETGHATVVSRQMDEVEAVVYELMAVGTEDGADVPAASFAWWPRVFAWVYLLGVVVCFGNYFCSLFSLVWVIVRGRRLRVEGLPAGVRVVWNVRLPISCSWMCWVILNEAAAARRGHPVMEHELAHVRLGHSWDMLLCELTARLLWFLPFAWMLRKDLRDVHEFQADRRVLRQGVEEEGYQHLLIRHAAGCRALSAANSFDQSSIKKRLVMMCRRPSARKAALKAVYIVPLVMMAVAAFARPMAVNDFRLTLEREEAAAPLLSPAALAEAVVPERAEEPEPVSEAEEPEPAAEVLPTEKKLLADSVPAADSAPAADLAVVRMPENQPVVPETKADEPAVVRRIATAPITLSEFFRMGGRNYWIELRDGETYLTLLWPVRSDEESIRIDGSLYSLQDMRTGDCYICRRIEGYPGKEVDMVLKNYQNTVVEFTLVFPPLEEGVKRIRLRHPQLIPQSYKLKSVLKKPYKVIR